MAQDFYAAFGLGNDDKAIGASDISGVALAAIQGLSQQSQRGLTDLRVELARKDAQLAALQAEIQTLKTQLSELETLKRDVAELQAEHCDDMPF